MTLRSRLALGIFVICVVLLVPLLLATQSMEDVGKKTEALRDKNFAASALLGRLRAAEDVYSDAELELGVVSKPEEAIARVRSALDTLTMLGDSLHAVGFGEEVPEIRGHIGALRQLTEREHAALTTRRTELADVISADSIPPVLSRLSQAIRRMDREVSGRTSERVAEAAATIQETKERTALAFALASAMAILIAALLTWSIGRPVRALQEGMARVADGEFDHSLRIPATRGDEFGRLALSFASMTRQLAELDKLKAEFVSVASHELKTPINVILGYVQLLKEGVFGDLRPKQQEVLTTIETQGHTLTRLVSQLLDISRFEAGVGRIEPRPFALLDFMRDLEHAFAVLAHQRGVTFRVTRADDVPDTVSWDYDRMNEVLGNLLSNAFKFTARGGRIELAIDAQRGRVLLEVKDTGAGISPEQLPRIFDKFYQADNQSAASAKGTGLGLAIAKSIVEAHGGSIHCESTRGVGTTFSIDLPARVQPRRSIATPRPEANQPVLPGSPT